MEQLKTCKMKTALYDRHCALGAKMVEFCGWEMPIHYQGVIQEHLAVRQHVGIFDVSHMGRILLQGPQAEQFLNYLSTNKISGKTNGTATYTTWCQADGNCVDDVIIYKDTQESFFVIVNAGNRQKDLAHLIEQSKTYDVAVKDRFHEEGILSIQGPKARSLVISLFPEADSLKQMHFIDTHFEENPLILSATGYTGSGGFEIFATHALTIKLWDFFLEKGCHEGIQPIGLGARDTLRLEMGYALYGHELSETIAPTESVSAWTVHLEKEDFLGKAALLELDQQKRFQYGIELLEPGIARADYDIFKESKKIGRVTSGTHSPSLNRAIAIVLVEERLCEGDLVEVQIRKNFCKAKVVKLPFFKESK